jgi:hypothetical protein
LLAKHGVVIVPRASIASVGESPGQAPNAKGYQPWQDTYLTIEWSIYGPDGSHVEAQSVGVGRDHLDKGATKAATQAFKYLLLHLFAVSDATDDADGHDYSDQYDDEPQPTPYGVTAFAEMTDRAKGDPRLAALLKQFAVDNDKRLTEGSFVADEAWARQVMSAMDGYIEARNARADAIMAEVAAEVAAIEPSDAPPGTHVVEPVEVSS